MKTVFTKNNDKLILTAKVDAEALKLFIDVEPKAGAKISKGDLIAVMSEFLAISDINDGVVNDIVKHLASGETVLERRIAKGKPSEPGVDGKLLLLVKVFTGHGEPAKDSRGYVNYSELHLFDNISKEQAVARIYPPKKGQDGLDVLGKVIPSVPGKPVTIEVDKSLIIKPPVQGGDDFQLVVAQSEGLLTIESGRYLIKEELVIPGDLDFHFGNVDFIGKVKVAGDVLPGFTVKAKAGIEIAGTAQQATLICPEGDIVIKGGVLGAGRGKIICNKQVHIKRAQEADIEAHGDIIIEKEAIDCKLRTTSTLLMRAGQLIGGEALVVKGAEIKLIGNDAQKKTVVHLCSDVEITKEFSNLLIDIASHEKAVKLLELHLGPLAQNQEKVNALKEPHKDKMLKLIQKYRDIQKSRIVLLAKKKQLLETALSGETLRVNFLTKMYGGVEVLCAEETFFAKDELIGPKSLDFIGADKKFVLGELKSLALSTDPPPGGAVNSGTKGAKKEVTKPGQKGAKL